MGGAGVNIGKEAIKLNAKEHGIDNDGFLTDENYDANPYIHFREDSNGQWTPRSIFADTEGNRIDEMLSEDIGALIESS